MAGRVISLFLLAALAGCAGHQGYEGGAKPDHKPLTAIVDGGVHLRCHVTHVRLVNNVVHLEC